MSQKPYKRKPGELEIRIRPDGRVYMAAVDDAMLDVWAALDPENPLVIKRREAKSGGKPRDAQVGS